MSITIKNYFVQNQVSQLAGLQNKVSFMMKARADWYRNRAEKLSKIISFMADLISFDDDDLEYFKNIGINAQSIRDRLDQGVDDVVTFVDGIGQQCTTTIGDVVRSFVNQLNLDDPSSDPEFLPIMVTPINSNTRAVSSVYLKDLTEYYSNNYYSMKGRSSMYSFLSDKGLSADFQVSELRDSITRDLNIDWVPAEVQDIIGPLPSSVNTLTVLQADCTIIEEAYTKYDSDNFTSADFDYAMTDAIQDALGDILTTIGDVISTFGKVIVAMFKGAKGVGQLIGQAVSGIVNLIFPDLGTWYSKSDNANALGLGIPYAQVRGNLYSMIEGYINYLSNESACFKNFPVINTSVTPDSDTILKYNALTPCLVARGTEAENWTSIEYIDALHLKMVGFINDTLKKTGLLVMCLGNIVIQITGADVEDSMIELYLTNQYPVNENDINGSSDLLVIPGQHLQDAADGSTLARCFFNDYKFCTLASLPIHAHMYGALPPSGVGYSRTFSNADCLIFDASNNDMMNQGGIHEFSNHFIDWSTYYNDFVLYNAQHQESPREVEPRDFVSCLKCFQNINADSTYNIIHTVQDYNNKASLASTINDPVIGIVVNAALFMIALSATNPASDPDPSVSITPFEDQFIRNATVQWTYTGGGNEHEYVLTPAYSPQDPSIPTFISSSQDDQEVFFAYILDAAPAWEFKPMSMQDKSRQVRPYLLSIICAAALAAVSVTSIAKRRHMKKKIFKRHQKMENAQWEYWSNPTLSNFNKLQRATRRFNKASGLNYVVNPGTLGSLVSSGSKIASTISEVNGAQNRSFIDDKITDTNNSIVNSNSTIRATVIQSTNKIISG